MSNTFYLECAYETDCGWASAPLFGADQYHYHTRALADKMAEIHGPGGDVIVIDTAAVARANAEAAALKADHSAHVLAYRFSDDDIPF